MNVVSILTARPFLVIGTLSQTIGCIPEKYNMEMGIAVTQWLRYCATNRKVAGSIPDGVIGIFH
jgi:hypothetical protein